MEAGQMGVVVGTVVATAVEAVVEMEMATDPTHRQQVEQTKKMKKMAFYLGWNRLFLLALPCYGSSDGYDSWRSRDAVGIMTTILSMEWVVRSRIGLSSSKYRGVLQDSGSNLGRGFVVL